MEARLGTGRRTIGHAMCSAICSTATLAVLAGCVIACGGADKPGSVRGHAGVAPDGDGDGDGDGAGNHGTDAGGHDGRVESARGNAERVMFETKLSPETITRSPQPGAVVPGSISFSPDGTSLTYLLADASNVQRLMIQSVEAGRAHSLLSPPDGGDNESNLSPEEKLRRERLRDSSIGVTKYAWSKASGMVLVPLRGALWLVDPNGHSIELPTGEGAAPIDARLAPDGANVAFVRDNELWALVTDNPQAKPRAVTRGASPGITHGLAEYVAQEEMDRSQGYWWSRDSKWLAYTEVDEREVAPYRIVHQGREDMSGDFEETHAYPFAGARNAVVRLFVTPAAGGPARELPLYLDAADGQPLDKEAMARGDLYLARVWWMPNGEVLVGIQDRAQRRLDLVAFDPKTGVRRVLRRETSNYWINLHNMFHALEAGPGELAGGFVWATEEDGYMHLVVVASDGRQLLRLTSGQWIVDSIAAVDEADGMVYFTGTKDGDTQRNLYSVPLLGGEIKRLTPDDGMHSVTVHAESGRFTDTWSSTTSPPRVDLRSLKDGALIRTIYEQTQPLPEVEELGIVAPELVSFTNADGVLLHGAIYRPLPEHFGEGPYPTIVSVYGGPHAQRVQNAWSTTTDLRAQWLTQHGFLVFRLDNRGSARRGLEFEGALRNNMGDVEVRDQVEGVQWLVGKGLTDPKNVGMYGWSYGGYMSAMSLARAPEVFKATVAGAPVTHWDGYDTHYTERYMGTPQNNPKGYEVSSVMRWLPSMKGSLMLIHGLVDENVHFRHTARLITALTDQRKDYELVLLPESRHGPRRKEDRIYVEERIRDFFVEHLMPSVTR